MGGGPRLIIKHPEHRKQVSRPRHLMTCLLSFYVVIVTCWGQIFSPSLTYFLVCKIWTLCQHKLISDIMISLDQRCIITRDAICTFPDNRHGLWGHCDGRWWLYQPLVSRYQEHGQRILSQWLNSQEVWGICRHIFTREIKTVLANLCHKNHISSGSEGGGAVCAQS